MELSKLHLHWRPSNYKGKTYKSYSLARAYRKDGKNRKEIVLPLGKLSDDDVKKWKLFVDALKKPEMILTTFDDIEVLKHYKYLELAVVNHIWEEWNLDKPFTGHPNKEVELCKIARILTMNRCVEPTSKSQVVDWFQGTWLSHLLQVDHKKVNVSRIFRDLSYIEDCKEQICKHLYENLNRRTPASMQSFFYDLSSATFSGSKCILMKWGHCKEGYFNHVVLALVVNKDGLPVYWEVIEGNTADSNTITWLLARLKRLLPIKNITLIFDRGMVSDENLILLETEGYKYITAMDRNQIEKIAGNVDFHQYINFDPQKIDQQINEIGDFTKLNDTTFYKEIKTDDKRRYILCFNPQLFKDQRKDKATAIENFRKFVERLNEELLLAKNSRDEKTTKDKFIKKRSKFKLKNIVDILMEKVEIKTRDNNGNEKIIKTFKGIIGPINQRKVNEAGRLDGFWLLVTNHSEDENGRFLLSPDDAIKPYRDKTIIESAFRDIKSFIEIEPIGVWTEKHVKAHFTICVLAYFINRMISLRLHQNPGNLTKDVITHQNAYKILSEVSIDKIRIKNVAVQGHKLSGLNEHIYEIVKRLKIPEIIK
ncbi:MAG: IS1634 family transposase [Bacteroidota bacterium]|nr:IS1634 family transposase [Bacteroidota bacterium]